MSTDAYFKKDIEKVFTNLFLKDMCYSIILISCNAYLIDRFVVKFINESKGQKATLRYYTAM